VAKSRRSYKGAAVSNTIGTLLTSTGTTITLGSTMSGWPTGSEPFFCVIEPGTAREEKVCVKYATSNSLTVVDPAVTSSWPASVNGRGVDDTTNYEHAVNSVIYPVLTAREMNDANELTSAYTANGDLVVHGSTSFKKIAVGTNNYTLLADSSVTDGGVKWGQIVADTIATGAVTSAKILDGTIAAGDLATATKKLMCPVGTISSYGGATAPTGWLLCNGDAIPAEHTELIALVGASTPDMKGRFPLGDNASLTLLATGGSTTIAEGNLPAHSHAVGTLATASALTTHTHGVGTLDIAVGGSHSHTFSGTTGDTTQAATQGFEGTGAAAAFLTNTNVDAVSSTANLSAHSHSFSGTTSTASDHDHSISGSTASADLAHTHSLSGSTATTGSGTAYYQPYLVVNFIIKHDY
jgi:microcystin-dependent protein